jgi:hypothetical protein
MVAAAAAVVALALVLAAALEAVFVVAGAVATNVKMMEGWRRLDVEAFMFVFVSHL